MQKKEDIMNKLLKWFKKVTQRLEKLIIKILVFDFAAVFLSYFLLYIMKDNLTEGHIQIAGIILSWVIVVSLLLIPVAAIVRVIVVVKHGFHNLRKCDDKLFENIDCFSVVSRADYLSKIGVINYYYQENGKIDKLIEDQEIDRLYARKDFLSVRYNLFGELTTYFYSLVISVIASFFYDLVGLQDAWQVAIKVVIIVIAFFVVILFKYVKRGQDGSFAYQIEEFELRLLEEKIKTLEDKIIISVDDEKIIRTRQYVISALQKLFVKAISKKTRSSIKNDIETMRNLRLDLNSCTDYELREIAFDGYLGYLAYLRGDNVLNNTLVSNDFEILYRMILKYFSIEKVEQERKPRMKPNEKHLEFLQNNIGRMNQCSFHMKGWAITLASAMIAVFVTSITKENPGNKIYIYAAIASTVLFWILDALYLSKERKFIAIYNDVVGVENGQPAIEINEYEIPLNKYKGWKYSLFRAMLLPSEILLYGLIAAGLVVFSLCV